MRPHPARRWRRAVRTARYRGPTGTRDRGANPVELAIVLPAVLVLLFSSVQAAAWFVARASARNAAQEAVTAQRAYQAPPGAGERRAREFLDRAGDWLAGWRSTPPRCTTSATEVSCTVRGQSLSVIPGVRWDVRETAHGTVERFTPEPP